MEELSSSCSVVGLEGLCALQKNLAPSDNPLQAAGRGRIPHAHQLSKNIPDEVQREIDF